jgi:hypothetical protein
MLQYQQNIILDATLNQHPVHRSRFTFVLRSEIIQMHDFEANFAVNLILMQNHQENEATASVYHPVVDLPIHLQLLWFLCRARTFSRLGRFFGGSPLFTPFISSYTKMD